MQISYPDSGTVLGGYLSFIATIAMWVGFLIIAYTSLNQPIDFYQETMQQLPIPNQQGYTMTYDTGFPAFQIYNPTSISDAVEDPNLIEGNFNNDKTFLFQFVKYD